MCIFSCFIHLLRWDIFLGHCAGSYHILFHVPVGSQLHGCPVNWLIHCMVVAILAWFQFCLLACFHFFPFWNKASTNSIALGHLYLSEWWFLYNPNIGTAGWNGGVPKFWWRVGACWPAPLSFLNLSISNVKTSTKLPEDPFLNSSFRSLQSSTWMFLMFLSSGVRSWWFCFLPSLSRMATLSDHPCTLYFLRSFLFVT